MRAGLRRGEGCSTYVFEQRKQCEGPEDCAQPSNNVLLRRNRSGCRPDTVQHVAKVAMVREGHIGERVQGVTYRGLWNKERQGSEGCNEGVHVRGSNVTIDDTQCLEAHEGQRRSGQLYRASLKLAAALAAALDDAELARHDRA